MYWCSNNSKDQLCECYQIMFKTIPVHLYLIKVENHHTHICSTCSSLTCTLVCYQQLIYNKPSILETWFGGLEAGNKIKKSSPPVWWTSSQMLKDWDELLPCMDTFVCVMYYLLCLSSSMSIWFWCILLVMHAMGLNYWLLYVNYSLSVYLELKICLNTPRLIP